MGANTLQSKILKTYFRKECK